MYYIVLQYKSILKSICTGNDDWKWALSKIKVNVFTEFWKKKKKFYPIKKKF